MQPPAAKCNFLIGTDLLLGSGLLLSNIYSSFPFFIFSGLTTWKRTTGTARGLTTCRSCSGRPSLESSGRSAKTSTIWFVHSRIINPLGIQMDLNLTNMCVHVCLCVLQVIILDPTQEYAAELLSVAEMFYANNIPLRFVFVSLRMKIRQLFFLTY